jgi:hypothetical protein
MPTARLSAKYVENIPLPSSGRADHWDSVISDDESLPGSFGLRVFSSGVKSWQVMYRIPEAGRHAPAEAHDTRQLPAFGLSEARTMAREALLQVGRGVDPAEDRKSTKARIAATPTLAEAAQQFIESYVKPRNRSWKETERIFNRYVLSTLGNRLLPTITRSDIAGLLNEIASGRGSLHGRTGCSQPCAGSGTGASSRGRRRPSPVASIKAPARRARGTGCSRGGDPPDLVGL